MPDKFTLEKGKLDGVYLISPRIFEDNRGFFGETYNEVDFAPLGITDKFVQDSHSHSRKNVLRGLHFQLPPHATSKLIRCFSGEILDVAVDLRPSSRTFKQWEMFTLSGDNKKMLYIPVGFAHGFYVKSETADIFYKTNEVFHKESDGGVRWDDPEINVQWPVADPILSEKDATLPLLKDVVQKLTW